ncbi:brachyurin-like [Hyposmocoma kahamanoa]|uniref:brachyurin-like n=1 Tax=Hyposmocoma kahamanoa TaxID=1477025 RepID=UPI000E6D9A05|nr:brachyurin-like [Hyposmocoma kahamanoa]
MDMSLVRVAIGIITQDQQLHHVYLQVISNEECAETFSFLPASNICTSGYGGRSVCGGDSGGPLTVDRRLVGIVSFGYAVECEQGYPEAYARVTSYSSWIAAQF